MPESTSSKPRLIHPHGGAMSPTGATSSRPRQHGCTAALAAAAESAPLSAQTLSAPAADPLALELANAALDAARSAGASYADVRVGRYRRQNVSTRERQVTGVSDSESYGLGVRALVDGSWGFAATSQMTTRGRAAGGAVGGRAVEGGARRAAPSRRAGARSRRYAARGSRRCARIRSTSRSRRRSRCCSRPTRRP